MALTARFLSPTHELIAETDAARDAAFSGDPDVLVILDDHWSPSMRVEAIPTAPGEVRDLLNKVIQQVRESTLLDAFGAVADELGARGLAPLADAVIEAARAIAEQPKVPDGWTAWGQIPRGSLSTSGDGDWLLVWPEPVGPMGRDAAWFEYREETEAALAVIKPEMAYRPDRKDGPFVRVVRSGLTAEQIDAFLKAPVVAGLDAGAAFERLFPSSKAA